MKRNKLIKTFIASLLLVGSLGTTALAYTHSSDKFEAASLPGLFSQAQSSKFYCGEQKHRATSRVKVGTTLYEAKDIKDAKLTAHAQTKYYKGVTEWNSYYAHL